MDFPIAGLRARTKEILYSLGGRTREGRIIVTITVLDMSLYAAIKKALQAEKGVTIDETFLAYAMLRFHLPKP